ncbi:MAG: hypothetical protein V3S08_07455 [Phycisphaerales bacterium]
MSALERMIARAGRRTAIDLALRGAGRGLAIGVGGGLALLVLDRTTGVVVALAAFPILGAVAAAIAIVLAVLRRPSSFDLAVRLDRRLGLQDRMGTGVAIRHDRTRGELTELARLDAQRVAQTVDVRRATPIRLTPIWPVALVMGGGLAAGIAFLPALDAAGAQEHPATRAALEQQRTEIVETIDETVDALDQESLDTISQQDLDTLERLARQLGEPTSDEIELARLRDESAATMQEMADRLARDAQRNLEVVDEVTRRFASAEQPDAPSHEPPAELREFLDAVRRGELDDAAERFDELLQRADELPAPSRQDIARELRELSERLDTQPGPDDPGGTDETQVERLREALDDLGVDEQTIDEILDEPDPARADRALEEALDEAAHDQTGGQTDDQTDDQTGDQISDQTTDQTREPPTGPRDESTQQTPDESRTDEEIRRRIAEDVATVRENQQVGEQADEQRQRFSKALEQAADELQSQQQQQQQQPTERVPRPDQPDPSGAEQDAGQESETPTEQPMKQPGETPGTQPTVSELLRQMQQMQQEAQGKQADSERLREAARKLADTMTDQQKQQLLEQWMRMQGTDQDNPDTPPERLGGRGDPGSEKDGDLLEQQRTRPPPPAFEDVDLRDLDEQIRQNQQVIAEWLSSESFEGAPAPAGAGGRAAVRRARNAAEQAVEKSIVPSRYHEFIRRYFDRLEKSLDTPPTAKPDADGGTQ